MMRLCPVCGQDASHAPNLVSEANLSAIIAGHGVVLGYVEARVLSILLKDAPNYIPTGELIGRVYGDREPEWGEGSVKVIIHRLKSKLAPAAHIESRPYVGYRLVAQ